MHHQPPTQLELKTDHGHWVIPHDCALLKALLAQQGIRARDLQFGSQRDCQQFVRQLALLSTQDELRCGERSELSTLTQQLVQRMTTNNFAKVTPAGSMLSLG